MPFKDLESRRANDRLYRLKYREKIRANDRLYRLKYREKIRAYQSYWYQRNREKPEKREKRRASTKRDVSKIPRTKENTADLSTIAAAIPRHRAIFAALGSIVKTVKPQATTARKAAKAA